MTESKDYEFKTEVRKLLNIITHSLYTNKEIFLRELISNASDALDKVRFLINQGLEVRDKDLPLEIRISPDKDKKILTVSDTGIGMTREELMENLGTIAKSGSEDFLNRLKDNQADAGSIIGRFGVGFYSIFMVAKEVVVRSQSADPDEPPCLWRSDGEGRFTIEDLPAGSLKRGTSVELSLREDEERYLDGAELSSIIKTHSNFISFPIYVDQDKANTIPAIWREPKSSLSREQYNEFYSFLTHDQEAPLEVVHVSVDAPVQFTSLMFIPRQGRSDFQYNRDDYGLDLYVRRVLIQHQDKDLIPEYLGFFKGVVDTEDLPLNISRETLQENALIRKIAATLTKQALNRLDKMAVDNPDDYALFWKAHSKIFKLGYTDFVNRDKFADLLRFNSSIHERPDELTSLDDYIGRARDSQKEIYYIAGQSREAVRLNPHLEIFSGRGVEVLYLYEPIDEFVLESLRVYKDYTFKSVESADLAKIEQMESVQPDSNQAEPLSDDDQKAFEQLLEKMKAILGDLVTGVRASKRLSGSPSCLVAPDGSLSSSMQRILQIVTKDGSAPQKVLEINRDHPLIRNLLKIFKSNPADEYLKSATQQLFESSLLLDGYLTDPHALVERINRLLENSSGWYTEIKGLNTK